jgi:hypothetical protein
LKTILDAFALEERRHSAVGLITLSTIPRKLAVSYMWICPDLSGNMDMGMSRRIKSLTSILDGGTLRFVMDTDPHKSWFEK